MRMSGDIRITKNKAEMTGECSLVWKTVINNMQMNVARSLSETDWGNLDLEHRIKINQKTIL